MPRVPAGGGATGQLGHGDKEDQHKPKRIAALRQTHVVQVEAGCQQSFVVAESGEVAVIGDPDVDEDDFDEHSDSSEAPFGGGG